MLLPTWELTETPAGTLGTDRDELRGRWTAAKTGHTQAATALEWLTSVRVEIPNLAGARSIDEVCAATAQDPKGALDAGWGVLRVGALPGSRILYGDIPGSWSSNAGDTYGRVEEDGRLPAGSRAVANTMHLYYVGSRFPTSKSPSVAKFFRQW